MIAPMATKSDKPLVSCPDCGHKCHGAHGLSMHRTLVHGKGRKDRPRKAAPRRQSIVLKEVYTDGGENGRILLTDQHGNWWVARKLDV